ncbi:MAG: hypothetical protein KFW07_02325 [Mycoplasmataceae bacterium]|nr:hypothetical protein [Mycoplasmataceae bacterium]
MKKNIKFIRKQLDFKNHDDIKDFWKSQIWKLEVKKNMCSLLTIVLNLIVALLNISIFILLILAVVMITQKVNSPNYNPQDNSLDGTIFLVSLSITLSIGIICSSFFLMSIKNKNKFVVYQKIYLDINDLFINYNDENIEEEIKKIIDKNMVFKKEKLFKSLKNFVSQDKIKWS